MRDVQRHAVDAAHRPDVQDVVALVQLEAAPPPGRGPAGTRTRRPVGWPAARRRPPPSPRAGRCRGPAAGGPRPPRRTTRAAPALHQALRAQQLQRPPDRHPAHAVTHPERGLALQRPGRRPTSPSATRSRRSAATAVRPLPCHTGDHTGLIQVVVKPTADRQVGGAGSSGGRRPGGAGSARTPGRSRRRTPRARR